MATRQMTFDTNRHSVTICYREMRPAEKASSPSVELQDPYGLRIVAVSRTKLRPEKFAAEQGQV